jgi:hypothetical protein
MPKRLYTGEPAHFITGGIGYVERGDLIEVPEELLEAFDRRADIEVPAGEDEAAEAVTATAGRRRPGGKQSGGVPAAEAQ